MSNAKKGKKLRPNVVSKIIERNQKPVKMIDNSGKTIAVFTSMKEAGIMTGINPRRISDVCLNKEIKQEDIYGKEYR